MFKLIALVLALVVTANLFAMMANAAPQGLSLRDRFSAMRLLGFDAGVVTLAQAALNATDAVDVQAIDEFRKSTWLLDNIIFDDVVSPTGGGTLTYGYTRLITQPTAGFRAINSEYTPQEVTKQRYTVDLKPLGGSFQIDRVLARIGSAAAGEVALQMSQKIQATKAEFSDAVINGDSDADPNSFDGLSKALRGSTTEYGTAAATDWSAAFTDATARAAMDELDTFLALLNGPADALLGNRYVIGRVRSMARAAGYYSRDKNDFGQVIERYGNTVLIDLGEKAGTSDLVIPVASRDVDNTVYTVTVTGTPTGGTFSLNVTYDGDVEETAAIAYNATAATVQAAIQALAIVPAGAATVTGSAGGPFTVTFAGALTDEVVTVALSDNNLTGGSTPSVTTVEAAVTTNTTGATDLYAVRLGLDGFHGVSMVGAPLVQTWLPDFSNAGAVKTGEVEMGPVSVALKATKAAAVFRNIKVQ